LSGFRGGRKPEERQKRNKKKKIKGREEKQDRYIVEIWVPQRVSGRERRGGKRYQKTN